MLNLGVRINISYGIDKSVHVLRLSIIVALQLKLVKFEELSKRSIQIDVEPEEAIEGADECMHHRRLDALKSH